MSRRMTLEKQLNHYSAVVLPFYRKGSDVYFVFERKDPKFKTPFFDKGLCFLGGNWKASDETPLDILTREIGEEFRGMPDGLELNTLLGQNFIDESNYIPIKPSQLRNAGAGIIGNYLIRNLENIANYVGTANPPIVESPLVWGVSIFKRSLLKEEFENIKEVIDAFNGIVTSDNVQWGSTVEYVTVREINEKNIKFSWGYDHVLNDLINNEGAFLDQKPGIIRPLVFTGAKRIKEKALLNASLKDFERYGFKLNWSTKK